MYFDVNESFRGHGYYKSDDRLTGSKSKSRAASNTNESFSRANNSYSRASQSNSRSYSRPYSRSLSK